MGAVGASGALQRTRSVEIPRIRADIDKGDLAMLGLVRATGWNPLGLTRNHQVLAYAYEADGDTTTLRILRPELAEPGRCDDQQSDRRRSRNRLARILRGSCASVETLNQQIREPSCQDWADDVVQGTEQEASVTEVTVDLAQLAAKSVAWDSVYLDPNNPRLAGVVDAARVKDDKIPDPEVQEALMARLRQIGIDDIEDKIKKLGYLTIDRIVVRPLIGGPGYVVLEGNRRIAALRSVRGNPVLLATLTDQVRASLNDIQVLEYDGNDEDIAWLIQGVRHIESVKEWGPYQQARFLVDLQDRRGYPMTELAAIAGVGRTRVARLVRSYFGWVQASQNPDFGDRIDEKDFSIFLEAVFHRTNSPIWQWLEWDDSSRRFANDARLSTMLGLLKDDTDGDPPIARVNPDLRDKFSKLVLPGNEAILNDFLNGSKTLDQAIATLQIGDVGGGHVDLDVQRGKLLELNDRLATLPLPAIVQDGRQAEFIDVLNLISTYATQQVAFLSEGPVDMPVEDE